MELSPAFLKQVTAMQAAIDAEAQRVQHAAKNRLRALAILEGHTAERAALTLAGVAEHQIFALYPFTTEQIVGAATTALRHRGLTHLTGEEDWAGFYDRTYVIKKLLGLDHEVELRAAFAATGNAGGYYPQLKKVIESHLVYGNPSMAADHAEYSARALIYGCWMMLHLADLPRHRVLEVMDYFSSVMEWFFPGMTAESVLQDQAAA